MSSHAASLQPPPEPPQGRRAARRRRRAARRPVAERLPWLRGALSAVVLLAVLAGFGGWIAVQSRGTRSEPAGGGDRVVAVGAASVTVPGDWAPARPADAGVPGLDGPSAVLALAPGLRAYAVTTLTAVLPASLRELIGPLGTGRKARLAGLPARAYGSRPIAGNRMAEVTVARTADGVLAVACIARTDAWAVAAGCAGDLGPARGGRHRPRQA